MTRLVVVGDALLDRDVDGHADRLAPDAPVPVVEVSGEHARPGGAGLAAALAAAAGHEVTLVCALGNDAAGARLRGLLAGAGVSVCDLGLAGATPEKVRVRAQGRVMLRLDRGTRREDAGCGPLRADARAALERADAILVSDYGHGVAAEPTVRAALAARRPVMPLVWDPHPHGPAPVARTLLVTPNLDEARRLTGSPGAPLVAAEAAARCLAARWRAIGVCVTLGPLGALLVAGGGPPLAVPAPAVVTSDPCGAGDSFAATAAGRLAAGALPSEAVRAAVAAASAFVAAGGAAAAGRPAQPPPEEDAGALALRVREAGGTVIATGGCFDLLHAGHVRMLVAARSLGDCLLVCLNGDESVRRLKGPGRPVVAQADRAAVLAALGCVDGVAIFDGDDPCEVLRDLRPHVWVKGGDYAGAALPEQAVLAEWDGQAVVVPFVSGRSTSRMIDQATVGAWLTSAP